MKVICVARPTVFITCYLTKMKKVKLHYREVLFLKYNQIYTQQTCVKKPHKCAVRATEQYLFIRNLRI